MPTGPAARRARHRRRHDRETIEKFKPPNLAHRQAAAHSLGSEAF
jgi:hypothetical protein